MLLGRATRAVVVALGITAVGAATLATSCVGRPAYTYDHYALPHCPDSAFTLPRTLERMPWRYAAAGPPKHWWSDPPPFATCRGFTVYSIESVRGYGMDSLSPPTEIEARLVRGRSCAIDVGFEYHHPMLRRGRSARERAEYDAVAARLDSQATRWSQVVARLLMEGARQEPVAPAASSLRTADYRRVKPWCRSVLPAGATADSARH